MLREFMGSSLKEAKNGRCDSVERRRVAAGFFASLCLIWKKIRNDAIGELKSSD